MAPAVKWRDSRRKGTPDFLANWRAWKGQSDEVVFGSYPMVETLRSFSPTAYVGWEMAVPDQFRADFILRELKELTARGEFPQLTIICLPNDHTSGTSPGFPTPAAHVADNDLAFGRIVEALSHSPFWREMADLRDRGRPAGRLGPRQRLPDDRLRREPVRAAEAGGEHAVQHHEPRAHDRADPGSAADEPARRERRPDVGRVHRHAGPRAVRSRARRTSPSTR